MAAGVSLAPGSAAMRTRGGGLSGQRLSGARTPWPRHEITCRQDVSPMAAREIRRTTDLECGCLCGITHVTPPGHVPQTEENNLEPVIPGIRRSGVPAAQRPSERTGIRYSFRLTSTL